MQLRYSKHLRSNKQGKAYASNKFQSQDVLNTKEQTNREVLYLSRVKVKRSELFELFVALKEVPSGGVAIGSNINDEYVCKASKVSNFTSLTY